jgi:hypothetical protein
MLWPYRPDLMPCICRGTQAAAPKPCVRLTKAKPYLRPLPLRAGPACLLLIPGLTACTQLLERVAAVAAAAAAAAAAPHAVPPDATASAAKVGCSSSTSSGNSAVRHGRIPVKPHAQGAGFGSGSGAVGASASAAGGGGGRGRKGWRWHWTHRSAGQEAGSSFRFGLGAGAAAAAAATAAAGLAAPALADSGAHSPVSACGAAPPAGSPPAGSPLFCEQSRIRRNVEQSGPPGAAVGPAGEAKPQLWGSSLPT